MKIIKMFGNTAGLVLIAAIALIAFSDHSTLLSSFDTTLFDLGTGLTSKKDVSDKIALVTLPVTGADGLARDPALTSALIQFLEKLNAAKPTAAVFMLDGYPQAVVNNELIRVENKLEKALAAADTDNAELSDILTYVKDVSEPVGLLAQTIKDNQILVAMKIDAQAAAWPTFDQNITPYKAMAVADPDSPPLLEWLPATTWFQAMPTIDGSKKMEGESDGYETIVPLYTGGGKTRGWPLVWKYRDGFLPDLITLLYQKDAKSADPVWMRKKGVRFDYYLTHTDVSGRIRPLLTSVGDDLKLTTFSLADMTQDNNTAALNNKIILIGSDQDPALTATALAFLSMHAEATAHTPVWAIWLEKGIILLFALYLVLLLQRLQVGLGIVLSFLLLFLSLTLQWGTLVTKGVWLPVTTAMVFLVAGHILIQFKVYTRGHLSKIENKKHDAFFELGTYYAENRRFDKAFEAFKECTPDEKVLDSLFDVGLDYERRQKLKRASQVYEYIDSRNKNFKDAGKRAGQLILFLEGKVGGEGGGDGAETINMPSFELQRTVLGRYEIERELGRGAMGIVYLGRDPKIGRRVAIKTLDLADAEIQGTNHENVKNRFFREAEAIGRLTHPNIVTVYDVGEEDDLAFIAMDFLTGNPLKIYTESNNLLPLPIVYKITIQVAEALAYAHSQNVIHRDIKPGNIIYNEKERLVKVTDFGIARLVDATVTSTHTILGSPSFMAPEQLKGAKVDGRADIFSLGVTFFQLLTGQFPFGGKDLATITYQITNEDTPDITKFRTGLPKSAKDIIYKALGKDPDQRYQSATEMAKALRRGSPRSTGEKKK